MSDAKQPAPKKSGGTEKPNQVKQVIIMAATLAVCAGLITWTVMLMRSRAAENEMMNEQSSVVDIREQTGTTAGTDTATTITEYSGFQVTSTAAASTTTDDTTSSATTSATHATAPATITVQSANFSRVSTTATARTTHHSQSDTTHSKDNSTTTVTDATTHTEPVLTPTEKPEGAQITYNQLLALYLGAEQAGDSAYYIDAHDASAASVILHGSHAYYVASPEEQSGLYNRLGGTGDSAEHPWQTESAFRIYQYDGTNRCVYYTSQGNNYQIIGYYDTVTGENVWARLHYYQLGVAWETEYHIIYTHRPDSANGTPQTEVDSGTCAADELYAISAEFEQALTKELQSRNISAGNWTEYEEIQPNTQADISTLWSKAGSYNTDFEVQSGGSYAVVGEKGASLYDAEGSEVIAELPAGAFISVDSGALPAGGGQVAVHALVNGTWKAGYIDSSALLAWSDR